MPTHSDMVFDIQQRPDYVNLSPNDLLSLFVSHANFSNVAEEMRVAQSITTKASLALTPWPRCELYASMVVCGWESDGQGMLSHALVILIWANAP